MESPTSPTYIKYIAPPKQKKMNEWINFIAVFNVHNNLERIGKKSLEKFIIACVCVGSC